jgi:hypothetical protein
MSKAKHCIQVLLLGGKGEFGIDVPE